MKRVIITLGIASILLCGCTAQDQARVQTDVAALTTLVGVAALPLQTLVGAAQQFTNTVSTSIPPSSTVPSP